MSDEQFRNEQRLLDANNEAGRASSARDAASQLGTGPGGSYNQERTGASSLTNDALNNTLKGIMSGMKIAKDQRMGLEQRATEAGGLFNRSILEAVPVYNATEAEGARFADGGIKGFHNTFIIMGRDRPASESSGGGADPTTHCGCIDIIAGMSSVLARETVPTGPDAYNKESVLTNKSPGLDAARIYISQISHKVKGIDLIAGNNDADLQPLVKGDNLKLVIDSQLELTKDLHTSVSVLYNLVVYFLLSMVDPSGYSAGRLNDTIQELPQEFINLWIQEMNFLIHELNYNTKKNPFAAYNFMSRHNTTN